MTTRTHITRRHELPRSNVPNARSQVQRILQRTALPASLKQRLLADVDGGDLYCRVDSVNEITALPSNASFAGACLSCGCCTKVKLVKEGTLGRMLDEGEYFFLAPGYHSYSAFDCTFDTDVNVETMNRAITNGPAGFVTITEGHIGLLLVSGEYKLLAPGTYCWQSAAVQVVQISALGKSVTKLGPYQLVTVPNGDVAVTYNSGELCVLGLDTEAVNITMADDDGSNDNDDTEKGREGGAPLLNVPVVAKSGADEVPAWQRAAATNGASHPHRAMAHAEAQEDQGEGDVSSSASAGRTYFLDDPCWLFCCFLSLRIQADTLESNNLLSRDNVELIMVAMSQWRIVDPVLAVKRCGSKMDEVSEKVNALIRATIARIVAGTSIGAGPVSGSTAARQPQQRNANNAREPKPRSSDNSGSSNDDANLAHLMQSAQATKHMAELTVSARMMGVEVAGVYVPEKRMKNDGIRREIASQAVIGIKADAERSAADAKAYATIKAANAGAQAIAVLAKAHAEAGNALGGPMTTAARLALTETTAKALQGAKITMFSGSMDKVPYAFTQEAMQ